MHIGDYDLYHDLLQKRAGLELRADQSYLLDSRLTPVSKKWGFPSLDAMTMALRGMPDHKLVQDIIEAMTDHETYFFMDSPSFRFFLQTAMPHLLKNRRHRRLRFWCAAASSGQEAYSLAIALKDMSSQLSGWTIEIMASDVSRQVLAQAEQGVYQQLDVQRGLAAHDLVRYFDQTRDGQWALHNEIKKMVSFRYFNLLEPMMAVGQFDAIFCRNVLSSFDKQTAKQVFWALVPQLAPDGYLFLGDKEDLPAPIDPLSPVEGVHGLFIHKDNALKKAAG